MQDHEESSGLEPAEARRIIIETLKKTKEGRITTVTEIAESARTTSRNVRAFLSLIVQTPDFSNVQLSRTTRLGLASEAVKLGAIDSVAKALSWQEFEKFVNDCLVSTGFKVRTGIIFEEENRRWQIDIVAMKGQILLSLDCKHWESGNYPSKFSNAVEHQNESLLPLVRHIRHKGAVAGTIRAIPLIITLFTPRDRTVEGVLFVSIGQLSDFLEHMSPADTELPFVTAFEESPISQNKTTGNGYLK